MSPLKQKKSKVIILSETGLGLIFLLAVFFFGVKNSQAVIAEKINYQGKLANASNVTVADGAYDVVFKLYTVAGGATAPIWTESWTGAALFNNSGTTFSNDGCASGVDKITYTGDTNESTLSAGQNLWNTTKKESAVIESVSTGGSGGFVCFYDPYSTWVSGDTITNQIYVRSGLFSTMLGSIQSLSAIDFNQTLYLGVAIGGDPEMKPRKVIGSAPSAFTAKTLNNNGSATLATTAGSTLSLGNTTGAMTMLSGGASSWSNTSGNLTVSTTTSGILAITSAGALNLSAAAASTVTLANVANSMNFDSNTLSVDALNNRVGIGTATPGAFLDIIGSTTASASLRIEAGATPSVPGNGDLWYQAGHLYFQDTTTKDLLAGGHTQNTDTGTTGVSFIIGSAVDSGTTNTTLQFGSTNSESLYFDGASTDNFKLSDDLDITGGLSATTAIAANGGITFDNTTDTIGAYTMGGNIIGGSYIITDIGSTATDFTTSGSLAIGLDASDANGALMVDNAAQTNPIIVAKDNGTMVWQVGDNGLMTIDPAATGIIENFALATQWTTGTMINAAYGSATTQTGAITGINLDFNANFTSVINGNLTGLVMKYPPNISLNASTETYTGIELGTTSGAFTKTTSGTFTSNGILISTPSATQTAGTVAINGAAITIRALTTGGTADGIKITPPATTGASTTTNGVELGTISTSNGTDTAFKVGTGWDTILSGTTAGTNLIGFSNFTVTTAGAGTFASTLAANGGITFNDTTDTVGAHTMGGNIIGGGYIITDIGNTGTDFVASTGALNLAGILTANGGISLAGGQSLTAGALSYLDLGSIVHNTTAIQGLRLPQAASATPSNPTSGEGYLAWDSAGNQLVTYNGTTWTTVGGGVNLWTDGGAISYLTATGDNFAIGGSTSSAPLFMDVANNTLRIGSGATNNGIINMYASDGDTGSIAYNTNDSWTFTGGNVGIGTTVPMGVFDIYSSALWGANVYHEATNAGADYPIWTFKKSRAGASVNAWDQLGQMTFPGVNSTGTADSDFGAILGIAEDPTSGSEDGNFMFSVARAGAMVEQARFSGPEGVNFNYHGSPDVDFTVTGDTINYLLFADASTDTIGVGVSAPKALLSLAAATATKSSLNIATGTAPTGGNLYNGDLWYETGHLYFRDTTTKDLLAGGGMAIGGTITNSPNDNSILFVDGSVLTQDTNFTWDTSTDRLALGQATASYRLDVATAVASDRGINIAHTGATGTNYGVYASVTGTATQNIGGYFTATGAATAYGLQVAGMSSATANRGLDIGTIAGAGTNYGINIGAISSTGTATGINIAAITANGATTNYGINVGGLTGAATTNNGLYIGAISGATNKYGMNVAAITGNGTLSAGLNITAPTSTSTSNYGAIIGGPTGAGTSNYGLNITSAAGATHNATLEIGTVATTAGTWAIYSSNTSNSYLAGNVGIGTTSPTASLDIVANTTGQIRLRTGASDASPNIGDIWFTGSSLNFRKDGSTTQDLLASAGGMTNPMTTAGDIIYGGTSGAPTRLGGSANDGYVLKYNLAGSSPYWSQDLTSAAGPTVSLAPSAADTDSSVNPSIWINDTAGGDLMRLQKSGTSRFTVDNSGGVTVNGLDSSEVRTTTAQFTAGNQLTNLSNVNNQLELSDGTVTGDGTITTASQAPVDAAIGAGSSTIQRADGKYLVIKGGSALATSLYDSLANTFTNSQALVVGAGTVGAGSVALPRPGGMYVVVLGNGVVNSSNVDPMGAVTSTAGPSLTAVAGAGTVAFRRNDGRFVVTLGAAAGTTNIYDPMLNTFVAGQANSGGVTWGVGALALARPNGDALFITGGSAATTQNYTAMSGTNTGSGPIGTFAVGPALPTGCEINGTGSIAIKKPNGKYIVMSKINVSAIYDPVANTWSQNAGSCTTPTAGKGPTVALGDGAHAIPMQDGRYLIIISGASQVANIYDPQTDTFTAHATALTSGGAGAHSIMAADGTWRMLRGGGVATNKFDTQLVMGGVYRSDDISTAGLNANSTLRWTRESETAFSGIGQGAGGPGVFTATLNATGGSCTTGAHSYRVTFMVNGVETYGGPASNEISCNADGNDSVTLTNIPVGPIGTTARRVYRIGTASTYTSYKLVNGGSPTCVLSDNTSATCTDTLADASLTTTVSGLSGAGAGSTVQFFVRTAVYSSDCTTPLNNAVDKEIVNYNDFIRPASEDNCIRVTVKFNRPLPKRVVDERERGTFTGNNTTFYRLDYTTPALFDFVVDNASVLRRSGVTFNFPLPNSEFVGLSGAAPVAMTAGAPSAGGSCTAGTHTWKYTYITGGQESLPSPVSAMQTCTGGNGTVALSGITTGPTGTTARKVYRTLANDTSQYYLLTTIGDNSTTGFSDNLADSSLTSVIPGFESSGPTFSRVEATADNLFLPYGRITPTTQVGTTGYYLGGNATGANTATAHPALPQAQTNAGTIVITRPNKTFKIIASLTTPAANGVIYDSASEQFSALQSGINIPTAANGVGGFALKRPDGKFLVVLGNASAVTNIYDPVSDTFVAGPSIPAGVIANGASAIPNTDGTFTIVQGNTTVNGTTGSTTSAIYDPVRNTMTAGPTLTTPSESGFFAIPLRNGMYKIGPGQDCATAAVTASMYYNPRTKVFSAGTAFTTTLVGCGAYAFQRADGWWEIVPGETANVGQGTTNIINPENGVSSIGAPMTTNLNGEGGMMIPRPNGTFWVLNGNGLATSNIVTPFGVGPAASAASGVSQLGVAPIGPVLPAVTGPGAVAFQRPDGKFVLINGNATGTTQLIDAGWYADGQYASEQMQVKALVANSTLEWKQGSDSFIKMEVRAASSQAELSRAGYVSVGRPGQSFYNTGGEKWVQVEVNMRREFPTWSGNLDGTYNSGGGMVFPYRNIPMPTLASYQISAGGDLLNLQSDGANVLRITSSGGIYSSATGGFFSSGADLAEYYTSSDSLQKGDIVAVDGQDKQSVKIAKSRYQKDLIGIVSTDPGFVGGAYTPDSYPIALVGRVPLNVSNENGTIMAGQRVTSGTLPGRGMKAADAGRVIGVAMESMDESKLTDCPTINGISNQFKCGQIMVFVNLADYGGESVGDLMQSAGFDSTTAPVDALQVENNPLLGASYTEALKMLGFLKQVNDPNSSLNARVNSEILAKNINVTGQVVSPLIVVDTLVAKHIKVESIEGLEFIQTGIVSAQDGVTSNTAKVKSLGQQIFDLQNIINGLTSKSDGLDAKAIGEIATGSGLMVGGSAEFRGPTMFKAMAEFLDKVIFRNNVEFAGQVLFNEDSAGYAIVNRGENIVRVEFAREYANVPIINASLSVQDIGDEDLRSATEDLILATDVKYLITNITTKGFEIKVSSVNDWEIPFAWQAVSVKDARTSQTALDKQTLDALKLEKEKTGDLPKIEVPMTTEVTPIQASTTPAENTVAPKVETTTNSAMINSVQASGDNSGEIVSATGQ